MNRNELIKWLLAEGMAEEQRGIGHVTADDLADALLERYEIIERTN